jgi:hypothetical protein
MNAEASSAQARRRRRPRTPTLAPTSATPDTERAAGAPSAHVPVERTWPPITVVVREILLADPHAWLTAAEVITRAGERPEAQIDPRDPRQSNNIRAALTEGRRRGQYRERMRDRIREYQPIVEVAARVRTPRGAADITTQLGRIRGILAIVGDWMSAAQVAAAMEACGWPIVHERTGARVSSCLWNVRKYGHAETRTGADGLESLSREDAALYPARFVDHVRDALGLAQPDTEDAA